MNLVNYMKYMKYNYRRQRERHHRLKLHDVSADWKAKTHIITQTHHKMETEQIKQILT